jgi:hypothetical protein
MAIAESAKTAETYRIFTGTAHSGYTRRRDARSRLRIQRVLSPREAGFALESMINQRNLESFRFKDSRRERLKASVH